MPNKVMTMMTIAMTITIAMKMMMTLAITMAMVITRIKYSQTVAAYSRLYETPEDLVSEITEKFK